MYLCNVLAAFCVIFSVSTAQEKLWPEEFDYIVVGAGAGGAAVAGRLAEDGSRRVLVLEAGDEPMYLSKIPYFAVGPFGGPMDWDFISEPNPKACLQYPEQRVKVARGKTLGGSTAINALMFTRGNRKDYDHWEALGNEGWGYDHLLPLYKKMETYDAPLVKDANDAFHGHEGPVHVQIPPHRTQLTDTFLEAGRQVGYGEVDINADTQTGFARPVFTINNGTRWSSYNAYLEKQRTKPNVRLLINALVTKVVFDSNKVVTGVLFEYEGQLWKATSKREVILSAGSIKSPHLLLLSGIGPAETLRHFQIPVVHDLPGVGQNLREHVTPGAQRFTFEKNVGIDNALEANTQTFGAWETHRQGPMTVPVRVQGVAFVHSSFNENLKHQDYPDIEFVLFTPPGFDQGLYPEALASFCETEGPKFQLILVPVLIRPRSVGNLTLLSSDPHDQPAIHLNLLGDESDIDILVDGMKLAYRVMDTKPFQDIGIHPVRVPLRGCEDLDPLSDDGLRCQAVHYTGHLFHPVGTCKMGPDSDPLAVVDHQLRVRGVKGLRVVDASIMPTLITGHTMAPALLIGEKAASMILNYGSTKTEL